jgi:hypothetical protein
MDLIGCLLLLRIHLLVPVSLEEPIRFPEDLFADPLGAFSRWKISLPYVSAAVLTPVAISPAWLFPEIVIVVSHLSFSSCFLVRIRDPCLTE